MNLLAKFQVKLAGKTFSYDCHLGGNVWGIFGPSGAGKTTFFHALAGLRKPDGGSLELNDVPLYRENKLHLSPHKRKIGYVFQDYRLFPHLSVLENLRYGENMGKGARVRFGLDEVVDLFGLEHCLHRMIPDLSGGEMQRITIARALLCGPELLLLDEPFKGLDVRRKELLLKRLDDVVKADRLNVLLVSHQLEDILYLTNKLLLIDDGTIIAYGAYAELMGRDRARGMLSQTNCRRPSAYHTTQLGA